MLTDTVSESRTPTVVITSEEKEQLKREILEELRRQDSLKSDIVKELRPSGWKEVIPQIAKHPVFVLVMGFFLTGVLGTFLTYRWQQREWDRQQIKESTEWREQQIRLLRTREIEEKHEIVEQVTKLVSDNNAAAKNILLRLEQWRNKEEVFKEYIQLMQNWNSNSSLLQQRVAIHFKGEGVNTMLQQIVDKEDQVNYDVETLIRRAPSGNSDSEREETERIAQRAKLAATVASEWVLVLAREMNNEIQSDIESSRK